MGYLHNVVEELKSGLQRTNPESSRVEDLNQGPPDFKFSAQNHSATPPPLPNAGKEDTDIPLKEPVSYKNTTGDPEKLTLRISQTKN